MCVCVPCVCVFVSVCVCSLWMTGLLLAECVFNIRHAATRCKAMQTVSSIPLRLSLMSLIGWSRHTPGSLGLSQEPQGRLSAASRGLFIANKCPNSCSNLTKAAFLKTRTNPVGYWLTNRWRYIQYIMPVGNNEETCKHSRLDGSTVEETDLKEIC